MKSRSLHHTIARIALTLIWLFSSVMGATGEMETHCVLYINSYHPGLPLER